MIVTKENRTEFLRTKNKFYIAGWVASEGNEKMQDKPSHGAYMYETYYSDYENGYSEQMANNECNANRQGRG